MVANETGQPRGHRPVLVVGGGFLGRRVATICAESGHHVTVLTRRPPRSVLRSSIEVRIGDARDQGLLRDALAPNTHVVWSAGSLLPAASKRDDPNVDLAPLELAVDLLAEIGGEITFFSSGGTVYGNPTVSPVPEDHPVAPLGVYAAAKVVAERQLTQARTRGVRTVVLRCGNVYGPRQQPGRSQGVIATAFDCALRGTPMPVFGDVSMVRDYVYVDDVVDVVLASINDPAFPSLVNVGTGIGTRLDALLDLIRDVTGVELIEDRRAARGHDIHQVVLDITRLRQAMPAYHPRLLPEGLQRTWDTLQHATREES